MYYNKRKVDSETKTVFEQLIALENDLRVTEPQASFVPKVRGRFRKQLIIKFNLALPEEARKILQTLSAGWSIDIDPISTT